MTAEDFDSPRPALEYEMCYSHIGRIPLGEPVYLFKKMNHEFCQDCYRQALKSRRGACGKETSRDTESASGKNRERSKARTKARATNPIPE